MKTGATASSHKNQIRFSKLRCDRYSRGRMPSVWKFHFRFPVRCRGEEPNAPKQKYKETHYRKSAQKRPPPKRRHSATLRNSWQPKALTRRQSGTRVGRVGPGKHLHTSTL
jgi:hypothetical protein